MDMETKRIATEVAESATAMKTREKREALDAITELYLDGYDVEKIAQKLGISKGSVTKYVHSLGLIKPATQKVSVPIIIVDGKRYQDVTELVSSTLYTMN